MDIFSNFFIFSKSIVALYKTRKSREKLIKKKKNKKRLHVFSNGHAAYAYARTINTRSFTRRDRNVVAVLDVSFILSLCIATIGGEACDMRIIIYV